MRVAVLLVLAPMLCACVSSHTFYLMGQQTGASGTGTVPANGQHGGPITIALNGKTYEGQWVYMEAGGSVGIGTATAVSGAHVATAVGSVVGLPTGGNGNVVAAAVDGSTLRCNFNFSEWDLKGIGTCQDNKGETYDLQIH